MVGADMTQKTIQIEPTTLEDYKQIVKDACGYLNNINISEAYLLQDYKEQHGDLKGMDYDKVLDIMWEERA